MSPGTEMELNGQGARRKLASARQRGRAVLLIAEECSKPSCSAALLIAGSVMAQAALEDAENMLEQAVGMEPDTDSTQEERFGEFVQTQRMLTSARRVGENLTCEGREAAGRMYPAASPERRLDTPEKRREFNAAMEWMQGCLAAWISPRLVREAVEEGLRHAGRHAMLMEQVEDAASTGLVAYQVVRGRNPPSRPFVDSEEQGREYAALAREGAGKAAKILQLQEWMRNG